MLTNICFPFPEVCGSGLRFDGRGKWPSPNPRSEHYALHPTVPNHLKIILALNLRTPLVSVFKNLLSASSFRYRLSASLTSTDAKLITRAKTVAGIPNDFDTTEPACLAYIPFKSSPILRLRNASRTRLPQVSPKHQRRNTRASRVPALKSQDPPIPAYSSK